ncbi:MAG TPA: tetratricopeptide repeat protein [Opitutaceae bacterium]|nr:tetratricopeptide repeat protein [Opitutaceae bacterium]
MKTVLQLIPRSIATALLLFLASTIHAQPTTLLAQAKAAFDQGDLASAETLLAPLATGDTPDAAVCHQLALVRQRQKRTEEAVTLLEQATKLDPTKPDYFSALGIVLSQRMAEAPFIQVPFLATKLRKAFERSVALDPNHLPGLIGLARFYRNAPEIAGGSPEKAGEYAQRVLKLNPFLGEIELGNIAENADDFAGALTHFEAASQLQPKNAAMHAAAGRMLAKLDRKTEARERLQLALKLDPKHQAAQKALAELDGSADQASTAHQ